MKLLSAATTFFELDHFYVLFGKQLRWFANSLDLFYICLPFELLYSCPFDFHSALSAVLLTFFTFPLPLLPVILPFNDFGYLSFLF